MSTHSPVTIDESKRLIALEKIIKTGLENFIEVGEALAEIRDSKLYRIEHVNFEDYCREKWGMSRIQAHRLTTAASVADVLPIGNKPKNEAQVRPLSKLKTPEEQQEAWQEATDKSGGKPTAKHVEAAVVRRLPAPTLTVEQQAKVDEANGESEQLWLAKSHFKKLTKKDRITFLKWANKY